MKKIALTLAALCIFSFGATGFAGTDKDHAHCKAAHCKHCKHCKKCHKETASTGKTSCGCKKKN